MFPLKFLEEIATQRELTENEQAVFLAKLRQRDRSDEQIATELYITSDAVRNRLTSIYQKFGIKGKGPGKYSQLLEFLATELQKKRPRFVEEQTDTSPQDWGDAPDTSVFYGRTEELETLRQWMLTDRCRVVVVLGMGGIGKTALAAKVSQEIGDKFEYVIWRSLRHAPAADKLLAELIEFFCDRQETQIEENTADNISRLINYLVDLRCLLILDNVETIIQAGDRLTQEGYRELIRQVGYRKHKSCVLLTSRELPQTLEELRGNRRPVRVLQLTGLAEYAKEIFRECGLSQEEDRWQRLIEIYGGHPSWLKIVAQTIQYSYDGNVSEFIRHNTIFRGGRISQILEPHFERLSDLEKQIVYGMGIKGRAVSIQDLQNAIFPIISLSQLAQGLEELGGRSLIEKTSASIPSSFQLLPVAIKFVQDKFIETVCSELYVAIWEQRIDGIKTLRSHALLDNGEPENVGEIHSVIILQRIVDRLCTMLISPNLEEKLNEILSMVRGISQQQMIGYADRNITSIIKAIERD